MTAYVLPATRAQHMMIKGVLSTYGITGLAAMTPRHLRDLFYRCRGVPVTTLWKRRRDVMPRRMVPTQYAKPQVP